MAKREFNIEVKFSWWFKCYVLGMWFSARIFKLLGLPCEPDGKKIEYWAHKACKVYVNGNRWKI